MSFYSERAMFKPREGYTVVAEVHFKREWLLLRIAYQLPATRLALKALFLLADRLNIDYNDIRFRIIRSEKEFQIVKYKLEVVSVLFSDPEVVNLHGSIELWEIWEL